MPGALQVHEAADGALAPIRLPGGIISAEQMAALAQASAAFGSATLELTAGAMCRSAEQWPRQEPA